MRRIHICVLLSTLAATFAFGNAGAWAQSGDPNLLSLDVPGSVYIRPGDFLLVNMNVSDLQQPVSGCQAFLNFSSLYFLAGQGDVMIAPGGGRVWEELIWGQWNTSGDLDVAVGVKLDGPVATSEDGTVVKVTLKARLGVEGATEVMFRPDADPDPGLIASTILSTPDGNVVWPSKSDNPIITIDGTPPNIEIVSITQDGQEVIGTGRAVIIGTVNIEVTADDPIHGGVASSLSERPIVTVRRSDYSVEEATFVNESPTGVYNYTWEVTASTPNGLAAVDASVSDRSGNTSTDTVSFEINKNRITGTVAMDTLRSTGYTFDRFVTFKATDPYGALLQTWLVQVHFVNDPITEIASGSFLLTDVPAGIGRLSAKTDWSLRRRQSAALGPDGQLSLSFTGATRLLGGDLSTDNVVNVTDYNTLRTNWFRPVAAADINGDGIVNTLDYNILKLNWFRIGDPL